MFLAYFVITIISQVERNQLCNGSVNFIRCLSIPKTFEYNIAEVEFPFTSATLRATISTRVHCLNIARND